MSHGADDSRANEVAELYARRPRSKLLRGTAVVLAAGTLAVWLSGEIQVGALFEARRLDNLERFLTREAPPRPLREGGDLVDAGRWFVEIMQDRGLEAMWKTLALAVAAIVLASLAALAIAPLCARTLAARHPFADPAAVGGEAARRGPAWRALTSVARASCVGLRALPEYILAFLLVALLPSPAWAAVLALAIHNAGILGRLYGETYENLPPRPLSAWRGLGATRTQIVTLGIFPTALPRLLLYFFYRFETCVREATVLGMLGLVSLGYWISEDRARMHYDSMLLMIGLGVAIVLVADLCSYVARAAVRRSA